MVGLDQKEALVAVATSDISERCPKRLAFRHIAHRGGDVRPTCEIRAHDRCTEVAGRAGDDSRVRRNIQHAPVVWAR